MLSWLKTWQEKRQERLQQKAELLSVAKFPALPQPKVTKQQQSIPSYLRTAKPNPATALSRNDRALANKDLTSYRTGVSTRTIVRDFAASSPDLAGAVFAYLRTAITDSYVVVARNLDGSFNREATAVAYALLTRFDVLQDYSDGFSGINSMRSNSEMLGKELLYYGAAGAELVLDKTRLPRTIAPVSTSEVEFYPDKSGKFLAPKQRKSGVVVDLDIPTFFYTSLDQDLLDVYAASPLEPAVQPVIASTEFMNDLRRIIKRVVHPRLVVAIKEEQFRKYCPADVLQDAEKLTAYMAAVISDLESRINGLEPEEALILFDQVGVSLLNNGNITLNKEWEVLTDILDSKLSTGAKALPAVLGHGSVSQNVASTETMLFMKNAAGAVQYKLNELYSRMLTLAVRLFGLDVSVDFKYASIDLRPEAELEAFRQMRQERIFAQLSVGFISNDQASLAINGCLAPEGMEDLSGTFFHTPNAQDPNANPYSNTSTGAAGGGALNQNLKSDAPQRAKGGQVRRVK